MYKCSTLKITLIGISCFCSLLSAAESQQPGFIIVGPAMTPEYQGSDDYSLVPMIVSQFNLFHSQIEIEGLTLRSSLYQTLHWKAGITAEFDSGRDNDIENITIAKFGKLDSSLSIGGYVSNNQQSLWLQDDNLQSEFSIYSDTSVVHDGYYATAGITYTFPMVLPWRLALELESTYANSDYMNTYFGVTSEDSRNSGLPTYTADASLRDISLNANVTLLTSPKWGAFLRLSATKLLDDAKDSPIVLNGNDLQYFYGLGVFYRFGE